MAKPTRVDTGIMRSTPEVERLRGRTPQPMRRGSILHRVADAIAAAPYRHDEEHAVTQAREALRVLLPTRRAFVAVALVQTALAIAGVAWLAWTILRA